MSCRRRHSNRHQMTTLSQRSAKIMVFCAGFVLLFGGLMLNLEVGSRFVFFHGERYTTASWWVALLLLPVLVWLMLKPRFRAEIRRRCPTGWVRRIILYPMSVALILGAVVTAPRGWIAAYTWAFGVEASPLPGHLAFVERHRPSAKGCDQRGTLRMQQHMSSLCLDALMDLPARGDLPVMIVGRQSSMGLLITRIAP